MLTRLLLVVLFLVTISCSPQKEEQLSSNYDATKIFYKNLCDFIVKEKANFPTAFVAGYYMRTLVVGYKMFGDERYLKTAINYADLLLTKQTENGYWWSGYGTIYLADTGSAIALFISLYKYVDKEHQDKYFKSIKKFVDAIERDDLITPSGAIGVGLYTKDGKITGAWKDEYTISSSLTGAQIFTWMYYKTKKDKYRVIAYNALKWILSTMNNDGIIPYVIKGLGYDLNKKDDADNNYNLWFRWNYDTSTYVGEGLIVFDKYCNNPEWKAEIREKIKPHIEFLLRTQNIDGSWALPNCPDQKRSPGVINFLIWYYTNVNKDVRIIEAIHRYNDFLLNPEYAKAYGILSVGGNTGLNDMTTSMSLNDALTSIAGRAVGDILLPGEDANW